MPEIAHYAAARASQLRKSSSAASHARRFDRFERARQLFFQYRDEDSSLTDCVRFAVMRELKVTTVITTDRHFRQVGFDVLPAVRRQITRKPRRS